MTLKWLFHTYQRNLLQALYDNPMEGVYLSELARRAGVDPGNTKRYLEKFADWGIIRTEKQGRTTVVFPDLGNPETLKIFELFEIDRTRRILEEHAAVSAGLVQAVVCLTNANPEIRLVTLFGRDALEMDLDGRINVGVVIGSEESVPALKALVARQLAECGFPDSINLVVRGTREADVVWKNGGTPKADLWKTRVVLFGESYLWRMLARHGVPVNVNEEREGMVVNV
jgi:hypothetical protein